jgi:peptidoglycan/xylan/chitin deacetylase (PgdA/CDA1 family)
MWRSLALIGLILGAMAAAKARADECANPHALGTSRVLAIDPRDFPRIGTVQYSHSLPLADHEVVLTFDDGPLPPYTNRILDLLAEQCVKANYFLVGRMARGYPDLVRRIQAQGHTIGTHSENHLLGFDKAPLDTVKSEIEQGIASVNTALGGVTHASSFFRIPGFLRRREVEGYLQSRGLVTWSADVVADDWRHISASEVVRRAITRLDERGRGILLLHDIQPATALAMPELLRALKARGYRIVQVIPSKDAADVPVAENAAPQPASVLASAAPATAALAASEPETPTPSVPPAASAPRPTMPAAAEDSLALAPAVPQDPTRPYTSTFKPAHNISAPGKFINPDPGGWPPVVSVPVPRAGGIGVSPRPPASETADGRFVLR